MSEKKSKKAPAAKELPVLDADAIMAADDLTPVLVAVPEWGGAVYIKPQNGIEKDAFEHLVVAWKGEGNLPNMREIYLAQSLCDERGALLFTEDDVAKLGKKNGDVIDRLFTKCKVINGFIDAADDKELEGN
jgi:hypothetical protein